MSTPPVIGFTLDHETKPTYSKLPWYAIRENYFTAVSSLGATPIGLPYAQDHIAHYLDIMSGLVVIGGDFDIDPKLYGDDGQMHSSITLKPERTAFEWAITQQAIKRNMPILGICGGEQLLAAVLGGSLIQHIPDEIDTNINHEQPNPRNEVGHEIHVEEKSLLRSIVRKEVIGVNSAHHQAVRQAGQMNVSATAPDGVIEAIELPTSEHPFCLGVQWHPEYHVTPADDAIWNAFIAACQEYQQ